jgi:arabinofuranosyltransferase
MLQPTPQWWRFRWDIASSGLLIACLLLVARYAVDFSIAPFEDAAMLMRYAQHVAEGHGIVWNIGEPPVDGATDFLFMVVVAWLVRLGVSVETAVRALGMGAHVLTVGLVYLAVRTIHNGPVFLALTSALYLAVGPGMFYVAAYFGTPFFAFFVCLTWCLAWWVVKRPESGLAAVLFSLSGLITGLIRPEGVILAAIMLLAILFLLGWRRSVRVMATFVLIFFLLGGLYFAWRWSYFGHPLPTPFVKKGGGLVYLGSLRASWRNTLLMALPFLPAFVLGLRSSPAWRVSLFGLLPVVGFASIFVLLSNEMNFGGRFQYATLPILLVSWYAAIRGIQAELRLPSLVSFPRRVRTTMTVFALTLAVGTVGYAHSLSRGATYGRDGRYDVGRMLGEYADEGLVLATSEAGLVPLYSRWRTVDAWGLNDPWIARNGGITEAYLDQFNPHVIMFHAWFSPLVATEGSTPWNAMTILLRDYAERRGYVLAAAYGATPRDVHYYYVRPDFAQSAAIVDRLRSMEYHYYTTGVRAIDFARFAEIHYQP